MSSSMARVFLWTLLGACATGEPADKTDDTVDTDTDAMVDTDGVSLPDSDTDLVVPDVPIGVAPLAGECPDRGDEIVLDAVPTWAEDVAPILYSGCVRCHFEGGSAPFSLVTYDDAKLWAQPIRRAVLARDMPPPGPSSCGNCQEFRGFHWMPPEAIATVRTWVDAGAPKGDPSVAPEPVIAPAALSPVSLVLEMEEAYTPSHPSGDDYHCFVLETDTDRDRFLTGFELRPGELRVLHHASIFAMDADGAAEARQRDAADPGYGYECFDAGMDGGKLVAAWTPGAPPFETPPGTGIRLEAGMPLVVKIHYNLGAGSLPDRSAIALRLVDRVNVEAFVGLRKNGQLGLPPGRPEVTTFVTHDPFMADNDDQITLWAVSPHMHQMGRRMHVEASRNGFRTCLVDVPNYDFESQGFYAYRTPVVLRKNDQFTVECTWDTTGAEGRVRWGPGVDDEMCLVLYLWTPGTPDDVR